MKKMIGAVLAAALALVALAGPAAAQADTDQRFKIVFVNSEDEATIVGMGPIRGAGKAFLVSSEDRADGSFVETYRVELPSGIFVLTATGANDSFDFDPRSCVFRLVNSGTFSVSDGTGAYQGVSGQGTFRLRLTGVNQRGPEGCADDGQFVGLASLAGKVHL